MTRKRAPLTEHAREYKRKWNAEHKDYYRAYYLANKAKALEQGRLRKKRYRIEDPEKVRAEERARYAKNRILRNASSRNSRLKHIEKRRAGERSYHEAHREELNAKARARQKTILHRFRAYGAARYAQKMNAMPRWADRVELQKPYTIAAQATRESGIKHVVDHFYPMRPRSRAFSGLHVPWNLRVILDVANKMKLDKVTPNMLTRSFA
ncbi:MAG: hypothetical protein V4510_10120 [bacterium]